MISFIQLSDTHIVAEGQLAYGRSDTAAALESAVASINAKLPLLGAVDCAIVTGDLTDHGTAEEYERFKSIMSKLELPYLAIPGNHDHRATMRLAFSTEDWMPASGDIHWQRDFGPFVLIGLDTLLTDAHYGMLSDDGFAFLNDCLNQLGDRPIIVATHHPWMHSGIQAMDEDNLRNGEQLMQRLQAYPGPVRMSSGHVHRALSTQIGKVGCQIVPATCHSVHLDQHKQAINSLIMEPAGVTVWSWLQSPTPTLVSNIHPIGSFAGPWPFDG